MDIGDLKSELNCTKGVPRKMKKLTKASKRKHPESCEPSQFWGSPSSNSSSMHKKMRIQLNSDTNYNVKPADGAAVVSSTLSAELSNETRLTSLPKTHEKPHNTEFQGDSLLESLPKELLLKIICCLHHDELLAVSQVSCTLHTAVMAAKEIYFNYKTPDSSRQQALKRKSLASKGEGNAMLESPQCPGAPVQGLIQGQSSIEVSPVMRPMPLLKMPKRLYDSESDDNEFDDFFMIPSPDSYICAMIKKMRVGLNIDTDHNVKSDDGVAIVSSALSAELCPAMGLTPLLKTPEKPNDSESQGDSLLESLPEELLVRIICHLHCDDLPHVSLVSRTLHRAVMTARELYFNYKTPDCSRKQGLKRKAPASKGEGYAMLESPQCPGAPLKGQSRADVTPGMRWTSLPNGIPCFLAPTAPTAPTARVLRQLRQCRVQKEAGSIEYRHREQC